MSKFTSLSARLARRRINPPVKQSVVINEGNASFRDWTFIAEQLVTSGASAAAWTGVDISAYVDADATLVKCFFYLKCNGADVNTISVRAANGEPELQMLILEPDSDSTSNGAQGEFPVSSGSFEIEIDGPDIVSYEVYLQAYR